MDTMHFAREELDRYLLQITGEKGTNIHLNLEEPADGTSPYDDAFRIDVSAGAGTITGATPRSILLGVYRFLTLIGCRFFAPGKGGEVIPTKPLADCTVNFTGKASLRHRGICIEGAACVENVLDMIDWLPKNGFNSYFMQFREGHTFFERWYTHEGNTFLQPAPYTIEESRRYVAQVEEEIHKRGLLYHKIGHGWTCECLGYPSTGWQTVEDSAISPEIRPLLAEVNGKREFFGGVPLNTNLCYSNPEVRRRFVEEVVQYARTHRDISALHIWLADNANNICECEACRARSQTDWYVMMLNDIDEKLTALGLDTRLVFLIYFELLWPPVTEQLRNPDRFIMMFAPITRTYTSPFYSPEEADAMDPDEPLPPYVRNQMKFPSGLKENLTFLHHWQQHFKGDSFDFDYHLMWDIDREIGGVRLAKVLYDDCVSLKKMGLNGLMSCQLTRAGFPSGLGQYVMGRVLFDTSVSFDELLDEYFEAAFGPQAGLALEYLQGVSDLFSHAYMRGQDEGLTAADYVQRFRQAGAFVRDMAPRIAAAQAAAEVAGRDRAWRVLRVSTEIYEPLAYALAEKAGGASAERLKELGEPLRLLVSKAEADIQPDLDGMHFNSIMVDFLERT